MKRALSGTIVVTALVAAACNPNDALKPPDPGVSTTVSKQSLPGLYLGAIGDFQVAWTGAGDATNGGHEGHVGMTAIFTDELTTAGLDIFTFRNDINARQATPTNTQLGGIFSDMSAARHSFERAAAAFAQFDPTNVERAEMLSLAGYTYIMFAEGWCSGVPFSTLNADGTATYGQPTPTAGIYALALAKFDSASTIANTAGDVGNLALSQVGRARVLLEQGQFANAGAVADSVLGADPTFSYLIENSGNSPRQYNGLWYWGTQNNSFGTVDRKWGNGLNYMSANDPRVKWMDAGITGAVGDSELFLEEKYPNNNSSVELSGATEATLISAEAHLRAGDVGTWATDLNNLRATLGIAALTSDSTTLASAPQRMEVNFRERAFWLWLTGQRLPDLRRHFRQDGINDFPDAPGTDIRFPVPIAEQNNPNFKQCLDVASESP